MTKLVAVKLEFEPEHKCVIPGKAEVCKVPRRKAAHLCNLLRSFLVLPTPTLTEFLVLLLTNNVFLLLFSCFPSLKNVINYYNENLSGKATPGTTCIPSLVFITRFAFHIWFSPWAWSYGALLVTWCSWLCFVVGAANLWVK